MASIIRSEPFKTPTILDPNQLQTGDEKDKNVNRLKVLSAFVLASRQGIWLAPKQKSSWFTAALSVVTGLFRRRIVRFYLFGCARLVDAAIRS